ncbi:MAG: macro domain-containing protein [Lachnospiraceae bacterium]|nr:macro domain-containing protein [Lachnospiraceae bacterium]
MAFRIVRNDITKMNTEAIVNTANPLVEVGPGCDSAVYHGAGYQELLSYRAEHIGCAAQGEAFITPGFQLPAKYIIHAVSPKYHDGNQGEEELLRTCYRNSFSLAFKKGIRSLAVPLISTGSFGYPKEEGMRIAADEIHAFLLRHEMEIILVVFDEESTRLGQRIAPDLEAYIDRNFVEDMLASPQMQAPSALREPAVMQALPKVQDDREPADDESPAAMMSVSSARSVGGGWLKRKAADKMAGREPEGSAAAMAMGSIFHGAKSAAPKMESAMEQATAEEDAFFEQEHESKLEERMAHMSDTFSQYLIYLIADKKMENAEVYKRAIVDKKTFSKIKNNVDYHPQKLTALCLCVGARLNLDETRDLLARAGYALSPCDKTDIIFSYFIENEIYDMIELDIQLEEHGLPCIIS